MKCILRVWLRGNAPQIQHVMAFSYQRAQADWNQRLREATRLDQRCTASEQKVGTYFLPLEFLSPVTRGWVQPIPQQNVEAPTPSSLGQWRGEVIEQVIVTTNT